MEKYILNTSDFEFINSLIKTTSSIDTLYRKMCELEVNGEKDTEEYQQLLDYLNISLEVENKLYSDAKLNYSRCVAIVNFILNKKLPDKFLNDVESIMQQDYSNRILRRILNVLVHKILEDHESLKEMLPNEMIELMYQIGMPNPDKIVSHAIYSSIELQKAFEKDSLNGFLNFLQEFIDNNDYKFYKKDLICTKYNTAFINKSVESEMISNKFEIPATFYINSRFVADITQTDLELYNLLKNLYGTKESTKQISEIIELGDMDYGDSKKAITSILRQCFMRANFLLMSDEAISDVNYEFHEFIEDKKYLERHPQDRISEQLIINCFKSIKKDKNKPCVLSFGYRKN